MRIHPDISKDMNAEDRHLIDAAGQNRLDATALHVAAWHGHPEMMWLLLGFQSPVNLTDSILRHVAAGVGGTRFATLP
jgi:Ankyrin repeats (many copies)